MTNIKDYIKKYGNMTFNEKSMTEIDEVILSTLSYVDFDGIVSFDDNKISIYEAGEIYFKNKNKRSLKKDLKKTVKGVKSGVTIFESIYMMDRYKDLSLYNYSYKFDEDEQFSAMFIDIDDINTFISFEGTDDLISGWKEDFELGYKYPVKAQIDAANYINNKIVKNVNKRYILGGHSKGGHLALVAAMEAHDYIKNKIVKVLMADSPGLLKKQLDSKEYKSIQSKVKRIIPSNCAIGLLLNHNDTYKIVSTKKNIRKSHDVLTWETKDDSFLEGELSTFSIELDKMISSWVVKYSNEEREEFWQDLFEILKRAGINSVIDVKSQALSSAITVLKESKKINPKSKQMIKEFLSFAVKYYKENRKN